MIGNLAIQSVKNAITTLQMGKMVILIDHPDRENEGDLVLAAEFITPEKMHYMISHSSGIVCLAITEDLAMRLELPLMIPPDKNTNPEKCAFTCSIDAMHGIKSGISVNDRVQTILTVVDENTVSADLVKPGHVFPLIGNKNGVYARKGHTEGAIELMKLSVLKPIAILCELMNADGSVMQPKQWEKFSKTHHIPLVSIEEIISYHQHFFVLDAQSKT